MRDLFKLIKQLWIVLVVLGNYLLDRSNEFCKEFAIFIKDMYNLLIEMYHKFPLFMQLMYYYLKGQLFYLYPRLLSGIRLAIGGKEIVFIGLCIIVGMDYGIPFPFNFRILIVALLLIFGGFLQTALNVLSRVGLIGIILYPKLREKEKAFINNLVNNLCDKFKVILTDPNKYAKLLEFIEEDYKLLNSYLSKYSTGINERLLHGELPEYGTDIGKKKFETLFRPLYHEYYCHRLGFSGPELKKFGSDFDKDYGTAIQEERIIKLIEDASTTHLLMKDNQSAADAAFKKSLNKFVITFNTKLHSSQSSHGLLDKIETFFGIKAGARSITGFILRVIKEILFKSIYMKKIYRICETLLDTEVINYVDQLSDSDRELYLSERKLLIERHLKEGLGCDNQTAKILADHSAAVNSYRRFWSIDWEIAGYWLLDMFFDSFAVISVVCIWLGINIHNIVVNFFVYCAISLADILGLPIDVIIICIFSLIFLGIFLRGSALKYNVPYAISPYRPLDKLRYFAYLGYLSYVLFEVLKICG